MRVWVNGVPDDATAGAAAGSAKAVSDPALDLLIEGESAVLELRRAANEADYLRRHIALMRIRASLDPARFTLSGRRGLAGLAGLFVRRVAWRLLRYQHEWFAFHENAILNQLAHEIDCLHDETNRRLDRIEKLLSWPDAGNGGIGA